MAIRSVRGLGVLAALVVAGGASSVVSAQVPAPDPEPVVLFAAIPGEREFSGYLIARPLQPADARAAGLTEAQRLARRADAMREMAARGIVRQFPEVDEFIVRVPAGETEATAIARMMATGAFAYVEPDWILYPIANCPNDPGLGQQWHHAANRLDTCNAWTIQTGSPTVIVAICDTGVRTSHQDLLLNRVEGYHVPTQTWESQGGPIADINGHGTWCTGAAAANSNNGVGVAGMGWSIGHRMLRVTDSTNGSASLSNLTLAARRAAEFGDKVASVSYSGVNSSSVFTTGTYVRGLGSLLVWAAGNSNVSLSGNREDDVVVVGATDQNDLKASFSNFGPLVDLVAPGVAIVTTDRTSNTSYASVNGTSFATPIVAGLAALIWSEDPSLTPAQVEAILRSTAKDLGSAGIDNTFGYGRVNAAAALAAADTGSGGGGGGGGDPPPVEQTIFADGFESGNLTAGGWVAQNSNAFASTGSAFVGGWGARLRASTWIEKSVSTAGLEDITVSYARRTANLTSSQWLFVEWWNGSSWSLIEQIRSNSFQQVSFVLPAGAANNASFKLRFRLNANSTSRRADVDAVEIVGTPIAP